MKSLMVLGAILGFLVGAGFGLAGRMEWPAALWHASVAALATSLLLRWWSVVWIQNLRQALEQRRAAASASRPGPKSAANAKI